MCPQTFFEAFRVLVGHRQQKASIEGVVDPRIWETRNQLSHELVSEFSIIASLIIHLSADWPHG